jgi:hypothetical protein
MKAWKFGVIFAMGLGLTLPMLATAKSLTLANATKKSFTVRINNYCSDAFGVMKANSFKVVVEEELNKLCGLNSSNCKAIIFKSDNCTGKQIADFIFDTSTGFKNSFHSAKHYSMTVAFPFNAASLTEALENSDE